MKTAPTVPKGLTTLELWRFYTQWRLNTHLLTKLDELYYEKVPASILRKRLDIDSARTMDYYLVEKRTNRLYPAAFNLCSPYQLLRDTSAEKSKGGQLVQWHINYRRIGAYCVALLQRDIPVDIRREHMIKPALKAMESQEGLF